MSDHDQFDKQREVATWIAEGFSLEDLQDWVFNDLMDLYHNDDEAWQDAEAMYDEEMGTE